MSREIEIKTDRIVEMLDREGAGGVILNGQHNFAWITAGASNGIDRSRENGAASVLITNKGRRFILANNIEMPRLVAEEVSPKLFEPISFPWQEEKASSGSITGTASSVCSGEIVSDLPLNGQTRSIEGSVARCRYELTSEEKDRLRTLGRDAGGVVGRLFERIRPGKTEMAIAGMLRHDLAASQIEPVVTLVASDKRIERYRHPVPSRKAWARSLLLVICAKRTGLIVSLSRIAFVGEPPHELLEKTQAAAYVHGRLLHATRPGITGAELYDAAANAYKECGFPAEIDKHHQGGAAGYRTREWVAHPASKDVVLNDQAFAWNPSITGTKVEETVIASGGEIENVTATSGFPTITHTIEGREYGSPGILRID